MNIARGIYLLKYPVYNLWTGIIVIVRGKIVIIDTALEDAVEKLIYPFFKEMNFSFRDISMVVNTHSHGDHIGGNYKLKKELRVPIAAHRLSVPKIKNPQEAQNKIRQRFARYIQPLEDDSVVKSTQVDIVLEDGDVIDLGNSRLEIIYTPGHDTDTISIYEPSTKTLFSGDSIQGRGTLTQGIAFYQDLGDYRNSLKKIKEFPIETIVAAHPYFPYEGVMKGEEADDFLSCSLEITEIYSETILKILREGKEFKNILEITEELIKQVGIINKPSLFYLPLHTAKMHLDELLADGEIAEIRKDGDKFWKTV